MGSYDMVVISLSYWKLSFRILRLWRCWVEKCALTADFFLVMTGFYTVGRSCRSFAFDNMLLSNWVKRFLSGSWLAWFLWFVIRWVLSISGGCLVVGFCQFLGLALVLGLAVSCITAGFPGLSFNSIYIIT